MTRRVSTIKHGGSVSIHFSTMEGGIPFFQPYSFDPMPSFHDHDYVLEQDFKPLIFPILNPSTMMTNDMF